jgi:hypothetical protein
MYTGNAAVMPWSTFAIATSPHIDCGTNTGKPEFPVETTGPRAARVGHTHGVLRCQALYHSRTDPRVREEVLGKAAGTGRGLRGAKKRSHARKRRDGPMPSSISRGVSQDNHRIAIAVLDPRPEAAPQPQPPSAGALTLKASRFAVVFRGELRTAAAAGGTRRKKGAGDEARTRDPKLGKLVLYQLSYTRIRGRN